MYLLSYLNGTKIIFFTTLMSSKFVHYHIYKRVNANIKLQWKSIYATVCCNMKTSFPLPINAEHHLFEVV